MPQPETQNWIQTSLLLRRGRAYDPWEHAEALGIQVLERALVTANEIWLPQHNTICLKIGMRDVHKRNALAHGIGHAALAHDDDRPKFEKQADRFATLYLIDPREFAAAQAGAPCIAALASELGVTVRLLEAYLSRST